MKFYSAKRLKVFTVAVLLALCGGFTFSVAHVYAAPGGRNSECGFFNNKCFTPAGNNLYTPVFNQGIGGGLSSEANGAVENKARFISYMEGLLGGNAQERTGAEFVMDLMTPGQPHTRSPNTTAWANDVNNDAVTIKYNSNQSYDGWNSGYQDIYHPSNNTFTLFSDDDAFFPESGSAPAIDFIVNGQIVFILKESCGNPLGDFPGLPNAPTWKLTGTSKVTPTTALRGQTVNFTHVIHNAGPDTARFSRNIQESEPKTSPYVSKTALAADTLARNANRTLTDSLAIPSNLNNGDVVCERTAFTNANGPGTANSSSPGACVNVFVPPVCGNSTTAPSQIQPGDKFTTTVSLGLPGGAPKPYTAMHVSIADPAIGFSTTNGTPLVLTPASGLATTMTYTLPQLSATRAGTYTITWQLFNGAASVGPSCTGTISVNDYPYFSAYGGDVSAGGNFVSAVANSCQNPGGDGVIGSWYNNQTATAGANTLFAAIALGQITGFGGGQNSATPGSPSMTGQTFANSGGGAINQATFSPAQGGNYGGSHCLLTPLAPSGTPADVGGTAAVGSGSLTTGSHSHSGNVALGGGTVGLGNNLSLFVTGDVYITGNILYAGSGGGWTIGISGGSNVPSFTLVATGSIYIDPGVTELDGTFVSNGGNIYTCGSNSGGVFKPMAAGNLYAGCNQQLTVYGSFVADQVNLMRAFGTFNNSTTTENPRSGSHNCANGSAKPVCAAEVFNMSPESYLSNPATQSTDSALPPWNAVTSLPPVL